jgi:KinB signaling pathway activation protein
VGAARRDPSLKLLRWYLRLLAFLLVVSAIGQLLLPAELGQASAWGVAPGWQREIAFWNVAMYIVIAGTLRLGNVSATRTVVAALCVLQFLVATNHAVAAVQTHALLNVGMSVVNYACVIFGIAALAAGERKAPAA